MAEESCSAEVVAVLKFDMQCYETKMTAKDVKLLARKYNVPLDLHPCAPTEGWTMEQLSSEVIGLYEQFFEFSGLRVPFTTFLLGTIRHFRVHISQLVPLGLNPLIMFEIYYRSLGISPTVSLFRVFHKISKQGHWFYFEKRVGKHAGGKIFNETFFEMKGWKDRFLFLDRRVVPDAMAWRHHDSDVYDAFSDNDFSILDVRTLMERVIDLHPVPLDLVFGAGLATTWDFLASFLFSKILEGMIALDDTGHDDGEPTALVNENRSASHSPLGSVSESVHNFTNASVFTPDTNADGSSHPLNCRNIEEGESSHGASVRAMALTDILERFENLLADYDTVADTHAECLEMVWKLVTAREDLEHNAKLYTDGINHYRAVKEEHAGCGQKVQILENEKNYLYAANHDYTTRIQSLEAELARKDSALTYSERMLAEEAKDREKLMAQLESLSNPFNMAIQAGWGKGLNEGCTNKEIMAILHEVENYDPYSDKKLYPMYDKLFVKKHRYAVSSLMDTAYRMSESVSLNVFV
nr:hypothetical protein [Tanacetum cinerariifolium]